MKMCICFCRVFRVCVTWFGACSILLYRVGGFFPGGVCFVARPERFRSICVCGEGIMSVPHLGSALRGRLLGGLVASEEWEVVVVSLCRWVSWWSDVWVPCCTVLRKERREGSAVAHIVGFGECVCIRGTDGVIYGPEGICFSLPWYVWVRRSCWEGMNLLFM